MPALDFVTAEAAPTPTPRQYLLSSGVPNVYHCGWHLERTLWYTSLQPLFRICKYYFVLSLFLFGFEMQEVELRALCMVDILSAVYKLKTISSCSKAKQKQGLTVGLLPHQTASLL